MEMQTPYLKLSASQTDMWEETHLWVFQYNHNQQNNVAFHLILFKLQHGVNFAFKGSAHAGGDVWVAKAFEREKSEQASTKRQ